ncbi:MAG: prepilin peptidase [Lachnospiraceae bacterium]
MIYFMEFVLYGLVFMMGAAVFSFLNVVIYRVPRNLSFVGGRSFCPNCKTKLRGVDMVPVVSFLLLGGKCHTCKTKISIRYLGMECLGGVLAVLTVLEFPATLQAVTAFAFLSCATVVALVDWDTMEIPNGFVLATGICGLAAIFVVPDVYLLERIIGVISVSVPLLLMTLAIPGAFGGGDIKWMAACGLFLGWKMNLLTLFLAVLTGGIYGGYLLVTKKKGRKEHFAFGPFLCMAAGIVLFAGEDILTWYLGFLIH